MVHWLFVLLLPTVIVILSYRFLRGKQPPVPYPPGPPPKPIIGNALDMQLQKGWLKYLEWSKQFNSDIIHLSVLGMHIVILNSTEDIIALLEKRSANYSSRPSMPLARVVNFENMTGVLPLGNTLRIHRKSMDEALRKDAMPSFHHVFTQKVHLLLGQLLLDPAQFKSHFKTLGASVTMAVAYGYDVIPGRKDHFIESAEFAVNTVGDLSMPGRTFLALFEFLGYIPPWIPGATTQKLCAKVRKATMETRNGPFQFVKQKMDAGTSKDCVLSKLLELHKEADGSCENEEMLKDIMATFYFAGVETMQIVLANFILAMTLYPQAQMAAQKELERVVGSERLPSFHDRASLPYIEALCREVYRWRPALPLSLPHATVKEDIYKGFYIAKGSFVFPNVWAMTRDEDKYPDPESFKPERFFDEQGILNNDSVTYVFGFGRRICPGRHKADNVVWLAIASVLATFNISKAKDENGTEIDVDSTAHTSAMTSHPLPFKCSIVPRSQQSEILIRGAGEVAWQDLAKNEERESST